MRLRLKKGTPRATGSEVAAHLDAAVEALTNARRVWTVKQGNALDLRSDHALVSLITDLQHEGWTIRAFLNAEERERGELTQAQK